MAEMRHEYLQRTVQDIINLYEDDELNLNPGFQRDSVWTEKDRRFLVDSIVRKYPLPAIFLYRREKDGKIIYDVIDGKQRIETILMFAGLMKGKRFWAIVQLPGDEEKEWVEWNTLKKRKLQHLITGYRLNTIEVDGDFSDIIDLFVRINSTGKALSPAEKRHARYYDSEFLKTAGKLATRYEEYFRKNKILSPGQITRMKHVEIMCEFMLSIHQGDVINKKVSLDRMMEAKGYTSNQIKAAKEKTVRALNKIKKMFPKLNQTRFTQISDYYTLVVLIAKFENERLILTDRRRNRLAWDLLRIFANGVDEVRDLQKKAKGPKANQEIYRDYLLTVLRGTDEISQRKHREDILGGLLQGIFGKKDKDRAFSVEQRRILWNTSAERKCSRCRKALTWGDLSLDHINPFSKGGRTELKNAALMHKNCNAAKGNREG